MNPLSDTAAGVLLWVAGLAYIATSAVAAWCSFRSAISPSFKRLLEARFKKLKLAVATPRRVLDYRPFYSPTVLFQQPAGFVPWPASVSRKFISAVGAQRVVLLGPSGVGKTTFIESLCRDLWTSADRPKPVVAKISASGLNVGGNVHDSLIEAISENVGSEYGFYRRWTSKRLLDRGHFLLFIDDLDYLSVNLWQAIESFSTKWNRNSFVFVVTATPDQPHPFAATPSFPMPGWSREQAKQYVMNRIGRSQCDKLLLELDSHRLGLSTIPLYWKFVVDAFSEDRIFEVFTITGENPSAKEADDFSLMDSYQRINLRKAGAVDVVEKQLGQLAIRLIKQNRSSFSTGDILITQESLNRLENILLREDDQYSFVHTKQQVLLAGKYVGKYWPQAQEELLSDDAKSLIWTAVFDVARRFISTALLPELQARFKTLSLR